MAKYNLETRYSVVGLIEHFNTSIAVMEQYLPGKAWKRIIHFHMYSIFSAFFTGATTRIKNTSHNSNRNPHPTPSNQIMYASFTSFDIIFSIFTFRDTLRRRLQLDIDFYKFAKQRLFSQWNSIIHLQSKSVSSWEKRNPKCWPDVECSVESHICNTFVRGDIYIQFRPQCSQTSSASSLTSLFTLHKTLVLPRSRKFYKLLTSIN